jgi:uncharacterized membrane protein YphA (DoxX/SURF4 family)
LKTSIHLFRIILGLVFIASAVSKLLSIDEFEIYVFSHNMLSFNLSALAARLLIGFEFFIGVMLLVNFYFRQVWLLSVLMLSGFTIYLAIISITGFSENCHCFGEMLKMSPIESMVKNGILLLGFIAIRKCTPFTFKYKMLTTLTLGLICLSLPTIISPPDFFYPEQNTQIGVVNKNGLDSLVIDNNKFPIKCDTGRKTLCFYSPKCRFCKLSERKISSIVKRNGLDSTNFVNIFWGDSTTTLDKFYSTSFIRFQHAFLNTKDFFAITGGVMPIILLIDDKNIMKRYNYRTIDESEIVNFFK